MHVEIAEPDADGAQLLLDHGADTRARLHQDQGLAAQLVERQRPAGEGVRRRADEHDLVPEERLERHRPLATRCAHDAELELPARYELDDPLRVVDGERDRELRVALLELAEEEGDDVRARARWRRRSRGVRGARPSSSAETCSSSCSSSASSRCAPS